MTRDASRRTRPQETSPSIVRDVIARAILNRQHRDAREAHRPATLGSVTLLPHQIDAVVRLRTIVRELHVALLADDVGLGKTYVALALARDYPETLIIAPAALLPMWRAALARADAVNTRLESLHRYSRSNPPRPPARRTLVIVDEAHHLRTPSTRRYRAVANAVNGCDLLLLSATPVHNTPRDLRALLALAIGAQADRLDDALLSRVIVRRTRLQTIPDVRERPSMQMPHDAGVLECILRLPAPLPAHDGAVSGALIRLGLLRAWCSSDAALAHSLRKRLLRGDALRHALEGGRHPTNVELRAWLVGEHEVQLAFPQLMAGHSPETGPLLEVLNRHLDGIAELLRRHQRTASGDAARANALREIMRSHPDTPVLAFSQYSETVRAVGRALSDIAGVGVLTGRRAWIASGAVSRQEALASFAPVAQGRPPPPEHQRIRLLLTTDLLSEGVNLQDAGVVVHLDLPWTDALRRQRVGRCARVGSPHAEVVVYRFEPPQGAESVMRLHARLQRKARLSERLVGVSRDDVKHNIGMGSAADAASEIRGILGSWLSEGPSITPTRPMFASVEASVAGFVALVVGPDHETSLVGGSRLQGDVRSRYRVSSSPLRLLPLLRAAAVAEPADSPSAHKRAVVRRALRRWIASRVLSVELGDGERTSSGIHRQAHGLLTRAIGELPTVKRGLLGSVAREAFTMIEAARGVASEKALREWVSNYDRLPIDEWIRAWRRLSTLAESVTIGSHDARALMAPRAVLAVLYCISRRQQP